MQTGGNTQIRILNTIHRCPACKKFSHTDGSPEALCEHCGSCLDPVALNSQHKYEDEKRQAEVKHEHPVFWVNVKPEDNALRRTFVRLMQGGQLLYAAIVSFLLWLVAVIAG
jgi:predicted amidophosphoribosyltransferase